MKTEVINFADFMSGDYKRKESEPLAVKIVNHVDDHKFIYGVAGMSVLFMIGAPDVSFAADLSGGIDEKAKRLYEGKFMTLAKWVIVGKGGFDSLNKLVKEDFDGAKKSFIQYLLIFCMLWGLPWSLDQVESLFVDGDI